MIYNEVRGDLFEYYGKAYLVHCISADFALGKGIALEFSNRYNLRNELQRRYVGYLQYYKNNNIIGDCLPVDTVLNLVTKERYWQKPTYNSIQLSLDKLKDICIKYNIATIAMPLIGCGLDRLLWSKVSQMIKNTFQDTPCTIIVVKK